jgi:DNA-binding transcriptional MerR regulator
MSEPTTPMPTVGEIARRLGVPIHRVLYVIRSRGLRPACRAGNARVFSEADSAFIEHEIARMAREAKEGRHDD